ncbi:vacuolar iron transporter homolog 1-like [Henckelia pumila]|uniref:vacuolar iron transporter homolog 1-like n=1 Tax=Henckelia pumila TaxID=405737 RepID=UPI003C6DF2C2
MAANQRQNPDIRFPQPVDHSRQITLNLEENQEVDYSKRSQWLRSSINLGANDGLVSTTSLMMGVGAVKQDIKAMILTGFSGQLDIELAKLKRVRKRDAAGVAQEVDGESNESLPNPMQAAAALHQSSPNTPL